METENRRQKTVICRTCLQQIYDSSQIYCLNSPDSDDKIAGILSQLNDCLPELDLNVTLNVVICGHCADALDFTYKFRKKCLKVEEYLISYIRKQQCSSAYVDLAVLVQQKDDASYTNYDNVDAVLADSEVPEENYRSEEQVPFLNFIKEEPGLHVDVKEEIGLSDENDDYTLQVADQKQKQHASSKNKISKAARKSSDGKKDDSQIYIETFSSPTGKRMHRCTECDYTSKKKSRLRLHVKVHTEDKPYKCTECDFSCKWKGYLKVHMSIHKGNRPFKCSQCSYSSNWKNGLIGHLRIHTGDKPYKCTECGFSSTSRAGLNYHLKIHN